MHHSQRCQPTPSITVDAGLHAQRHVQRGPLRLHSLKATTRCTIASTEDGAGDRRPASQHCAIPIARRPRLIDYSMTPVKDRV